MTAAIQQPEPRRAVLCDTYDGGCGKSFSVPLRNYQPGGSHLCADCTEKQNKLDLLRAQLLTARAFGHTDEDCYLCATLNQIDSLMGYDWREDYERRTALIR